MKKLLAVFVILSLVAVLFAACGGSSTPAVHLGASNFTQSSITISKGESLNLVDDQNVTHIISNGSWVNGTAKPATESGAPVVHNLTFNSSGQSQTIGPFNTPGTYHFYCSVHLGMNLTVTVQ
jgi:plastocyanin